MKRKRTLVLGCGLSKLEDLSRFVSWGNGVACGSAARMKVSLGKCYLRSVTAEVGCLNWKYY